MESSHEELIKTPYFFHKTQGKGAVFYLKI